MNIKTPLAAALLFSALNASAQSPLLQPSSGLGPLKLDAAGFNTTNMPSDDDFNCSTAYNLHIPYKMCTPEQEARRLVYIGYCGASLACKAYFERIMLPKEGALDVAATVGGATGVNGTCPTPPCLKEEPAPGPQPIAASSGRIPVSGDPDFIGPPLPPDFYAKQDQKNLAEARREIGQNGVKEIIELGDGSLAKMHDDGMVEMCGRQGCEKPVHAEEIKNPKIERWVVDNQGYGNYRKKDDAKSSPGGFSLASNNGSGKSAPNDSASMDESGYTPSSTENDGSPYDLGRRTGGDIASLSGGGGSDSGGRSSGGDSSGGYASAGADVKPIPVSQAEVNEALKKDYTFRGTQAAAANSEALIKGGAKALETNVDPHDENLQYRGIQSEANR